MSMSIAWSARRSFRVISRTASSARSLWLMMRLLLKWHERCTICNIKLIYSSEMRHGICKLCRSLLI